MEPIEEREQYVYETYEKALGDYTARYEYIDRENNLLVTKIRQEDSSTRRKTYRMITPYYGGFIRKGPETPWPLYFLNYLDKLKKCKGVVVVEGEKCADALKELHIPTTTALSSSSVEQTDWSPLYGRPIVIWPDNDPVGYKYATAVERVLSPHCKVNKIDPIGLDLGEKEDVVDYIERGHGSADIRKILTDASKKTPANGVSDYIEGMIDGSIRAIEWPWELLHRFSQALLPGTITVLCGPPGSSKSLLLMEALAGWLDMNIKVALYVLEENKEFHLLRALAQISGITRLTEPEWVRHNADKARTAMSQHKGYLDVLGQHLYAQPQKQTSLNEISSWMREQFDAGCRIVVVDPISAAARGKDIWTADEEFVLNTKKLVDEYKSSVIFVTHPNKQDSTPYLNNIRGGAAWQQFVQNVFWLEKMQGTKFVQLTDGSTMVKANRLMHILKARNAKEMNTGVIAYLMKDMKFIECGEFESYEK